MYLQNTLSCLQNHRKTQQIWLSHILQSPWKILKRNPLKLQRCAIFFDCFSIWYQWHMGRSHFLETLMRHKFLKKRPRLNLFWKRVTLTRLWFIFHSTNLSGIFNNVIVVTASQSLRLLFICQFDVISKLIFCNCRWDPSIILMISGH